MPQASPEYNPKLFLRAIDRSEDLRKRLANSHPKEWGLLTVFRTELGDTCTKVRGTLSFLWGLQTSGDAGGFFQALRDGKYGE